MIFDRKRILGNRNRIHIPPLQHPFDTSIQMMMERLSFFKDTWGDVIEVGALHPYFSKVFLQHYPTLKSYTYVGLPQEQTNISALNDQNSTASLPFFLSIPHDEEDAPLPHASYDLVLGHLSWHFINDFPGFLKKIHASLRSNGILSTLFFGGQTLYELHHIFSTVYFEQKKGITPIVTPFIQPVHLSPLLQQAGFQNPLTSVDTMVFYYDDLSSLLKDIHYFGGQASLVHSEFTLTKNFVERANTLYKKQFARADGKIPMTLELLFAMAEKSSPSKEGG